MRKRPYMVFHEPTLMPDDEEPLSHNGSYPSGHTTLGWTTALILCEINPAAQDALLKEGFEYGQSRVIAGFHWQSDVDAARVVAAAAFARLHTSNTYLKQLKKAQKEFTKKCKKQACCKKDSAQNQSSDLQNAVQEGLAYAADYEKLVNDIEAAVAVEDYKKAAQLIAFARIACKIENFTPEQKKRIKEAKNKIPEDFMQ